MQNSALILVFVGIVFGISNTLTEVVETKATSLFRGSEYSYANFVLHQNSKLETDDAIMASAQLSKQCAEGCTRNTTCLSFNFGTQPVFFVRNVPHYLCELLPIDKYNPSSKFQNSNAQFHHYSIQVSSKELQVGSGLL